MDYKPFQIGDKTNRFALVQEGQRTLFVIGLNPSTADSLTPDQTMKAVLRIAEYNHFDGFIMINLYPLRATEPSDLPVLLDKSLHEQNLEEIKKLIKDRSDIDVWLAYGANIKKRKYFKYCLSDIVNVFKDYNVNWYYINELTKEGFPKHPLYQKTNYLKPFDIKTIYEVQK